MTSLEPTGLHGLGADTIDAATDVPQPSPALNPDRPVIVDYWSAPADVLKWYFPDGVQYIEYTSLNYGQRSQFNRRTNKEFTVERKSGNAKIKADVAGDTDVLLDLSIVGWYVYKNGNPVAFTKANLASFSSGFPNPELIDDLQKAISKVNPWLNEGITVELIDEQITELQERRAELVAEEEKK